jgi:hypothetical protein
MANQDYLDSKDSLDHLVYPVREAVLDQWVLPVGQVYLDHLGREEVLVNQDYPVLLDPVE